MPTEQELIALFGDDFNEILMGLEQLPLEVRELLDNTMGKMIYDADVFANRINKTAQTQASAGIASTATRGTLAADMAVSGAIFGELRNSIKESLVEGINQSGSAGAFQAYDPEEETLFTWVCVSGHKICQDCAPRAGLQAKLKDWESQGVPGSGWSVCGGHCYCILDPSGKISPRIQYERDIERKRLEAKGKFMPMNGVEARIVARKALRKAELHAKETDALFKGLAEKHGAKMTGLEFHLKTEVSLTRKIVTESVSHSWGPNTVMVKNIKDALRYTMIVGDAKYAKTALAVLDDLQSQGWGTLQVKNTWHKGSSYKGLNCALKNPNGQYIELQFHTRESFRVKMDISHPIYEQMRAISITEVERHRLMELVMGAYDDVIPPSGWAEILQIDNLINAFPGWNNAL